MDTAPQPPTQRRSSRSRRFKKVGDGTLIVAAILISAMALAACWFGVRAAETSILRYEAKSSARSWTVYLLDNLPHLANIMAGQGVTEADRSVIGAAIGAGSVLRFKIIGSDGRVVYASRQDDIGKGTVDPNFRPIVQKGHLHSAIQGIGPLTMEPQVTSEAYVPIISGGKFLGAVKIYTDVTARAHHLFRIGFLSFLGLVGFVMLIALVMTTLVAKNFEGSLRAKRALATSRKRLESFQGQLVREKENAEAASLQRFGVLTDVMHEIRTPVGGVIEVTGLLAESDLTDRQRRWVGTITQSAETVLNAVDNVLDLSLIEADAVEIDRIQFDLPESIAEVVETLAGAAADKKLEIAYYVAANVPQNVRGDPRRLHQVLFTIMGKAIDRTDRGEVAMRVVVDGDTAERATVLFEVRDTGGAMSQEDQAALSAPIDPAAVSEGLGGAKLGLSVCHHLIREMGGELSIDSTQGEGTCFRFSVPFDGTGATAPRLPQGVDRLAGHRILVVDDSAATRETLLGHFADWSVEAEAAPDGESAMDRLRQAATQGKPFDVVVVDMTMPGMSGLDLATAIRAEASLAGANLVMMTTLDAPSVDTVAGDTQIQARIDKPVHAQALVDEIGSAMLNASASKRAAPPSDGAPSPAAEAPEVNDMAEKYLRHTRISLEKLRDAITGDNAGAVQMTADSLKSSSLDIGATALAGLCHELESMARVGNLGGVQSMLGSIEEEYSKVCETLHAELSGEDPDSAGSQSPSP